MNRLLYKAAFNFKLWLPYIIVLFGFSSQDCWAKKRGSKSASVHSQFADVKELLKKKKYTKATLLLYKTSKSRNRTISGQSMGLLVKALYSLKLYNSAFFVASSVLNSNSSREVFKEAIHDISRINKKSPLSYHVIAKTLSKKVSLRNVPARDKGFFSYNVGLYYFNKGSFSKADYYFKQIKGGYYYLNALFHKAILNSMIKKYSVARDQFRYIISNSGGNWRLRDMAHMNLGRLYYENNKFNKSLDHYAKISKRSDNWLTAIFESSWIFFRTGLHNKTLGNILTLRSDFFRDRFFPEAYILEAITYYYLCFYKYSGKSIKDFQKLYIPVSHEIKKIHSRYKNKPSKFFEAVNRFKSTGKTPFKRLRSIFDELTRSHQFKTTRKTIKKIDKEIAKIRKAPFEFSQSKLAEDLIVKLSRLKKLVKKIGGEDIVEVLKSHHEYLLDLSYQANMIKIHSIEGKIEKMQQSLQVKKAKGSDKKVWGEGMKSLTIKSRIEYWPFQGEYWWDEVGSYVYNIESVCGKKKK